MIFLLSVYSFFIMVLGSFIYFGILSPEQMALGVVVLTAIGGVFCI